MLDAEGRIRYENARGKSLGKAVDALLAEMREGSGGNGVADGPSGTE